MASSQCIDNLAILMHEFQEEMRKTRDENAVLLKKNEDLMEKMKDIDKKLQCPSGSSAQNKRKSQVKITASLQTKVCCKRDY